MFDYGTGSGAARALPRLCLYQLRPASRSAQHRRSGFPRWKRGQVLRPARRQVRRRERRAAPARPMAPGSAFTGRDADTRPAHTLPARAGVELRRGRPSFSATSEGSTLAGTSGASLMGEAASQDAPGITNGTPAGVLCPWPGVSLDVRPGALLRCIAASTRLEVGLLLLSRRGSLPRRFHVPQLLDLVNQVRLDQVQLQLDSV